ncbi:MAG: sulfurtransferase TusA family protein [Halococcoides sp.]
MTAHDSTATDPDIVVDSRGATCPGPLMDLIGKVKEADEGTVIELRTGDSGSKNDVPEWLDEAGHAHLGTDEHDDHWRIYAKI